MAEFARIRVAEIFIGERTRPIDEDHAQAIAASMAERGQINPITVRRAPARNKGKTPFTLVAGGHRLRGAVVLDWTEIDAMIVAADEAEAVLLELSENLFRNDLSKLDRALFVMKFRELWEERNGKIFNGGNRKSVSQDEKLIFLGERAVSEATADRLGISVGSVRRLNQIAQNLHPSLRSALRGTGAEDDQSLLLKLAKRGPTEQAGIASALRQEPDLKKVLIAAEGPKPKPTHAAEQAAILSTLRKAWKYADHNTRRAFLDEIGNLEDFSFLEAAE